MLLVLRKPREAHPKLAIVITDEVLRPHAIGGGFPKLLCSPGVGGRSCDADVDHFARLQFDDEEGKQRAEEEIRDRQGVRHAQICWACVCKNVLHVLCWLLSISVPKKSANDGSTGSFSLQFMHR